MQTLALSEFRANVSAMVDLVQQGGSVRILRHGKPVAELVPVKTDVDQRLPSWKRPIETARYLRTPEKTGAQLIVEERERGQ